MSDMPRPRPPFLHRQVSRHGKTVWYFRRGHGPRTRINGEFGSKQFNREYETALNGKPTEQPVKKASLQWLVNRYVESAPFKALAPSTQRMRHNVLKAVCKTGGKLDIGRIDRQTVAEGRDRRADTPFAAITYLKTLSQLFDWAVDSGYMRENPAKGVKRPKVRTTGFVPWTDQHILDFCKVYPVGTRERLALDIFLFTGLRRQDAPVVGPQHIRDGVIEYRAHKNAEMLFIPVPLPLAHSIDVTDTGDLAFLTTEHGRPFKSSASFGNWFGKVCAAAGLDVRAHGLRKKAAQLLAENGGTNPELKALFGWRTDSMAGHYTRLASARQLAKSGSAKLNANVLFPHPEPGEGSKPKNHKKSDS